MERNPLLLTRKNTGLLIIDVQEKFAPVIPDFDEVVENVTRLVLAHQMYQMPILVTEQYPKGLGETVSIIKQQFDILEIIEKLDFSVGCVDTFWSKVNTLGLKAIVLCGVESHVCICQSALDLIHNGLTVHVITDAIGSRRRSDHETALIKMERAGALLSSTEMALFELTERAGTEAFKNISRLVKGHLRQHAEISKVKASHLEEKQPMSSAATEEKEAPVASPSEETLPVSEPEVASVQESEVKQEEPKDDVHNEPVTAEIETEAQTEQENVDLGVVNTDADADEAKPFDISDSDLRELLGNDEKEKKSNET